MSVYIRTAAGTAEALNPSSKLPRNLRQLLVAIDGSSSGRAQAERIVNPGELDDVLDALQRSGLIRRVDKLGAQHGDAGAGVSSAASNPFSGFASSASVDTSQDATEPADLRRAEGMHYALGNVISLMSDFVTRQLPERSVEIVLALECMGSIRQVLSGMDNYRALVTPLGDVAHEHLAELQRMLDAA